MWSGKLKIENCELKIVLFVLIVRVVQIVKTKVNKNKVIENIKYSVLEQLVFPLKLSIYRIYL